MFDIEDFDKTDFYEKIKSIIAKIPCGKVSTYGMIALLAGRPKCARMVGRFLSSGKAEGLPAHRVVNHKGRTAPGWHEQKFLLESEGVVFLSHGRLNPALSTDGDQRGKGGTEKRASRASLGQRSAQGSYVDLKKCLWEFYVSPD